MHEPPLNPSQHVERIREILVGRQLHHLENRLRQIENTVSSQSSRLGEEVVARVQRAQETVLHETQLLRRQLEQEGKLRREQFDGLNQKLEASAKKLEAASNELTHHDRDLQESLSKHLEEISEAMASRIDARVREVLQHLQAELVHWKNQVDRDMQAVRDESVSRTELKSRFAKLASAAMEDDPEPGDGFLL